MEVIKNIIEFLKEASENYPYLTKSLVLHFLILILISGLVPSCSKKIEKPKVIAINIVQAKASPKPTPPKVIEMPKKKMPEKKKEQPKKKNKITPKKIVKKVEKKPEPKPEPKPKPKQKEAPLVKPEKPKKVEEKKPEPKPEEKKVQTGEKEQEGKKSLLKDLTKTDDSLGDLIEDIEKEQPKPKKVEEKKLEPAKAEWVPDAAFVNDVMGKIQSQISNCWSIPIGAKNVQDMNVRLFIVLDREGNVTKVEIMDLAKYNSDNFYRVLADSAVWAVKECSPVRGLPRDKHNFWKEIEFTFDPAYIL